MLYVQFVNFKNYSNALMFHFIIAISQRDYKVYYGHLAQRKYQIMAEITTFFKEKIKGKFPIPNCK